VFNDDGTIDPEALTDKRVVDLTGLLVRDLRDTELKAILSAIDPNLDNWAKSTTASFNFSSPFQVHFYRHIPTNSVRFDVVDFKIKFNRSLS
jgi:hypothetical protein